MFTLATAPHYGKWVIKFDVYFSIFNFRPSSKECLQKCKHIQKMFIFFSIVGANGCDVRKVKRIFIIFCVLNDTLKYVQYVWLYCLRDMLKKELQIYIF